MKKNLWGRDFYRRLAKTAAALAMGAAMGVTAASAQDFGRGDDVHFWPGNLVVSRSVYHNDSKNVTVGEALPLNCPPTTGSCVTAVANGLYPYVFNNAPVDASFGVTSRIFLDQMTPFGFCLNTLEVPNSLQHDVTSRKDQMVTSFSSKSELALNLSLDGRYITFMGYVAPVDAIDESNSNDAGSD